MTSPAPTKPPAPSGPGPTPPDEPEPRAKATQLPLIQIDGIPADGYAINFSGRIELELNNPSDRAVIDDLLAGNDVRIELDAWVVAVGGKFPRTKEGDDVRDATKTVSLKVHSLNNKTLRVLSSA